MITYTAYKYVVHVVVGLYQMGGKMIPNFCYSHLIMINTLCTFTVQYKYEYSTEYTVQYKVYHYFLLVSILFGGLAHCTVQSVFICSA